MTTRESRYLWCVQQGSSVYYIPYHIFAQETASGLLEHVLADPDPNDLVVGKIVLDVVGRPMRHSLLPNSVTLAQYRNLREARRRLENAVRELRIAFALTGFGDPNLEELLQKAIDMNKMVYDAI